MNNWKDELAEIMAKIEKYEILAGLRTLATFVRSSLYSDRDFLDNILLNFRWYTESIDVQVKFLDPCYQIEISLGYLSIKQDATFKDLKQKLLENKTEFVIRALSALTAKLEDILYKAQQAQEDP